MLKEIKYLIFVVIIILFLFFTGKYYFSNENIKKSYRSYKNIDEKIKVYSKNLPLLKNDTENIIEYVKQTDKKKRSEEHTSELQSRSDLVCRLLLEKKKKQKKKNKKKKKKKKK